MSSFQDVRELLNGSAGLDKTLIMPGEEDEKKVSDNLGSGMAPVTTTFSSSSSSMMMNMPRKTTTHVPREILALMGDEHAMMPTKPTYKEKLSMGISKAIPWNWTLFENRARQDQFKLSHWIKASDQEQEYKFAKFNKGNDVPSYTIEEYEKYLKDDQWNREETDRLFNLCRQLDRRFVVVWDRFNDEACTHQRSMEELKHRYYSIVRKLIQARARPEERNELGAQMKNYDYDIDQEVKRKKHLEILYGRTPEQLKEEERLLAEYRRLEHSVKRIFKDRQHISRLISVVDAVVARSTPGISGSTSTKAVKNTAGSETPKKRKKTKVDMEASTSETPTAPVNITVPMTTETDPIKESILSDPTLPASLKAILKKEKIPSGVYTRSSRMVAPLSIGAKLTRQLEQSLEQLGLPLRPTLPTAQICKEFDELRQDLVTLLELKKHCDQLDYEIKVLRQRQTSLERDASSKESHPQTMDMDMVESTAPA